MRKEYIRLLKSSQTTLVFFVKKKNSKKRMVQDYWYLNKWTHYPLPLILDIIENTGTKKVFIKMDLQGDYNNIQIKEEDKWKTVFTAPEGLFKPMVIVVATTRHNDTCSLLTSAKLLVGYLVVKITRELDKEPSLHCSSIYINTMWSVLQQYLPALKASCPITHPPCFYLKTTMPCPCALTLYSLISITMHASCVHHEEPMFFDITPNPNSF